MLPMLPMPTRPLLSKLAFLLTLLPFAVFSATETASTQPNEIHYLPMSIGLFGGLAIFLYGMEKMSDALKRVAGNKMKQWLAKLTTNRLAAVATGTGITAIIQSSSVTTVLLVGFISAGLMTLPQAIGVIMGANIGTTVTAQIIAFKVTKAALAMVAIGFTMFFVSKKETTQHYGNMLFGLGLIFLGMNLMSEAMEPLRSYQPFIQLMAHMHNFFLAILISALARQKRNCRPNTLTQRFFPPLTSRSIRRNWRLAESDDGSVTCSTCCLRSRQVVKSAKRCSR
ncbi:Na/Pi cotransporter family protein [Vibrio navarrensis]|uniref:Na/Pi cotransporter family protein n=1 Tax=Vibrio navarrensis TaxID=29495 RepID=UPI001D052E6E|nr:Na/Pi symporter [Vibrio navarrensis]